MPLKHTYHQCSQTIKSILTSCLVLGHLSNRHQSHPLVSSTVVPLLRACYLPYCVHFFSLISQKIVQQVDFFSGATATTPVTTVLSVVVVVVVPVVPVVLAAAVPEPAFEAAAPLPLAGAVAYEEAAAGLDTVLAAAAPLTLVRCYGAAPAYGAPAAPPGVP